MNSFADFWDELAQRNRVREAARLVPSAAEPTDAAAVLDRVRRYCDHWRIGPGELARAVGVEPFLVEGLYRDSGQIPEAARTGLAAQLSAWMQADYQARLAERPANFVPIRPARLILAAAQMVKNARTIGLVTGPAGVGKSVALQVAAAELPGTILIRVDADGRGWRGLLRKIAIASQVIAGRGGLSLESVIVRVRASGRLLIVDEGHQAFDAALELVRSLHDQAELPVLLCGTVAIARRLRDDADPLFGQFSSRIGVRLDLMRELFRAGPGGRPLEWVSAAELRQIYERERVKFQPDALRMLVEIGNFDVGHLRRARNVVRLADALASADGAGTISAAHVLEALRLVTGAGSRSGPEPPVETRRLAAVGGHK